MVGPKWMRKNSRAVVFVFMALLLVAFLLGDVLQWLGGGGGEVNRTVGRAVNYDINFTYSDAQYIDRVQQAGGLIGIRAASIPTLEFFLLAKEADRMGIQVGPDQVRQRLVDAAGAQVDQLVSNLMTNMRVSQDGLFDMLAIGMKVEQAVMLQSLGAGDSAPRMRHKFAEQSQAAEFRMSVIDAAALLPAVPEPTESELQAFFEKHRDQPPQPGGAGASLAGQDQNLSFGYRLPDRVQIEYITLAPEQIKTVRVRAAEAEKFFQQHPERYMKTVSPDAAASAPADQVPMTFAEAESQVREDYRQIKAIETAQQILNDLRSEAFQPWSVQPLDEKNFRRPPPNPVSLKQLADRHSTKNPIEYGVTDLVAASDLAKAFPKMPRYRGGGPGVNLGAYAFRVQGLYTPTPERPEEMLAVGEPSQVLLSDQYVQGKTMPYQPYLFRVVKIGPAGPPEDFATVREQVRQDLKLQRAFDLAGEHARTLASAAESVGLDQAVEQAGELKQLLASAATAASQPSDAAPAQEALRLLEPSQPMVRFTRSSPSLPGIGAIPNAAELIFGLAKKEGEHRTAAVPAPAAKKWLVVELLNVGDLYEGDFIAQREGLRDRIGPLMAQMKVLDPVGIKARAGWKEAEEPEDGSQTSER